jgi:hypothetical protein
MFGPPGYRPGLREPTGLLLDRTDGGLVRRLVFRLPVCWAVNGLGVCSPERFVRFRIVLRAGEFGSTPDRSLS